MDMENKYIKELLKIDSLVDILYKKLAELEYNNKLHTNEYMEIIKLLRHFRKKELDIYSKCNNILDDNFSNTTEKLIKDNNYDEDDCIDYMDPVDSISAKRFIEHSIEQAYIKHNSIDEKFGDACENISINGEQYSLSDGIEILKEMGVSNPYQQLSPALNQLREQVDKQKIDLINLDNLYLYKFGIEAHTYVDYINDTIESFKNKKNTDNIRKYLIDLKYRIIGICNSMENSFLKNPYNYSLREFYQQAIINCSNEYPDLYNEEYIKELSDTIKYSLVEILSREKDDYENDEDLAYNIGLILRLSAILSSIYDNNTVNELFDERDQILSMSNSDVDSEAIEYAFKLKRKFIIPRK